jgi:predicted TPR repeat methyltransferase
VTEWRLFEPGTIPEYTTAAWYLDRERAPHLEEPDHQPRLHRTAADVFEAVETRDVASVVDLGCGDGGLLSLIQDQIPAWGYDLSPKAVHAAQEHRGVDARLRDVSNGKGLQWADLTVVTEVLEHLVSPHGFLGIVARNSRYLVASSPAFETDRDHYEFHTWAWDMRGYRAMVERAGYRVLRHDLAGGFQVIMGAHA